jgi:hypothetical protein
MYQIPVIDNSILQNSEFSKMYEIDLLGGNFQPVTNIQNHFTGNNTTKFFIDGGSENQNLILQNNYNPFEEQTKTTEQARQIIENQSILGKSISQTEREINMYSNSRLDPRLRQQMAIDSLRDGTNLFSAQSEDFVKEVRDSYGAFLEEEFLYRPEKIRRINNENPLTMTDGQLALASMALASGQDVTEIKNYFINKLINDAKEEQSAKEKMKNAAKIRRERFFPMKKEKTQEERFFEKYNII